MQVQVKLSNIRIAPRKSQQVIDLVRGKNVADARALLTFTIKKGALPVLKLLNSAVATSVNDLKLEESNLYISKITVGEGPKLKRWHPMSRGRAYPLIKRTSHIILVLSEKNVTKAAEPKKDKAPKAEKTETTAKVIKKPKATNKKK